MRGRQGRPSRGTDAEKSSNVGFTDLYLVCEHYFGAPRHRSGSHVIFKMPWPGDPRINIQNTGSKAKTYQVRQAIRAIDKLKEEGQ